MDMLGTTLLVVGLTGIALKVWDIYMETKDPPREYTAKVAKTRLDTKKDDGNETYTYIITFYLPELNRYAGFNVSQKIFDETMEKDEGILRCNLKRLKFLEWRHKKRGCCEMPVTTCKKNSA